MKQKYQETIKLSNANIDAVSEKIQNVSTSMKVEKKNMLRLKLLVEAVLTDSMKFAGEGADCAVSLRSSFGKNILSMRIKGEKFNPLKKHAYDDEYILMLIERLGVSSKYTYTGDGTNQIDVHIPRKKPSDVLLSVFAIVSAVVFCSVLSFLPKEVSEFVSSSVLSPVGNAYLSLIATGGALMVFLSLVSGITRMKSIRELKNTGGTVINHLMLKNIGYGIVFAMIVPFVMNVISPDSITENNVGKQILDIVIGIVPKNVVEPFQKQNALQLSFMALLLGIFLLINKSKAETVIKFFTELNLIVISIINYICSFISIYIFIVFSELLLSGNVAALKNCWVIIALVIAFALLFVFTNKTLTRIKYKVSVLENLKNSANIAFVGFITTSSMACLESNRKICMEKYNTDGDNLDFSIVIQQILYKVDILICFLCCLYGFGDMFGITFTLAGYIVMTVVTILMAIVVPPVPGGSIAIITSIFASSGFPSETNKLFISIYIFINMIVTGAKVFCVSDELLAIDRKIRKQNG